MGGGGGSGGTKFPKLKHGKLKNKNLFNVLKFK
jgi:hypothetical protein